MANLESSRGRGVSALPLALILSVAALAACNGERSTDLGTSADVVFDCVAVQRTVDQAVAIALKGGTVVVVGVPAAPVTVPLPEIQDLQVRIQGSATYTRDDLRRAIAMLEANLVSPVDLITARFPLTQADTAFAEAASGRQVKVVVLADA